MAILSARSDQTTSSGVSSSGQSFPFSAATTLDRPHLSGIDLQIQIAPSTQADSCHVTGDILRGSVVVTKTAASHFPVEVDLVRFIRSLSIRFSCESRCMFWHIVDEREEDQRAQKENLQPTGSHELGAAIERTLKGNRRKLEQRSKLKRNREQAETVRWSLEPEWARATFGEFSLVSSAALQVRAQVDETDRLVIPFEVAIPVELNYDEWNRCPGADRSQHRLSRPSPPSCRDSVDVSVEWIAEAILDLSHSSRGDIRDGGPAADTASLTSVSTTSFNLDQLDPWTNSRGFCTSKPSRIVTRTVYPVMTADSGRLKQDLADEVVPSFASEERARLRTHAGRLMVPKIVPDGKSGAAHYMKVIDLRSTALSSRLGNLTVEVRGSSGHVAQTALFTGILVITARHTPAIVHLPRESPQLAQLLSRLAALNQALFICCITTQAQSGFGSHFYGRLELVSRRQRESAARADSAQVSYDAAHRMRRKSLTSELHRRLRIPLDVPLSICAQTADTGRYKVRVPFDLRAAQGQAGSETLLPSFKTANAEREVSASAALRRTPIASTHFFLWQYTLTVSVRFSHSETEYIVGIVPVSMRDRLIDYSEQADGCCIAPADVGSIACQRAPTERHCRG